MVKLLRQNPFRIAPREEKEFARAYRETSFYGLLLLIMLLAVASAPGFLVLKNLIAISVILATLKVFWQTWLKKRDRSKTDSIEILCELIPRKISLPILAVGILLLIMPIASGHLGFVSLPFVVTMAGALMAWVVLNSRLRVVADARNIEATGFLYKRPMLHRPKRSWDDVHSVRLSAPGPGQSVLVFDFSSGGSFTLPLHRLTAPAFDALMLMLARFADPLTLNSDVIALQKTILTVGADTRSLSFTKFWQDSLDQSFAETNFVPLARGHTLQDGALTVLMPLSSGGTTAVYLCTDSGGKHYVLKEMSLPTSQAGVPSKHLELFAREAQILAKLDHPKIVRVLDNFWEQNRHYILLQFVPGTTLRQCVQLKGALDENLVRELAAQIAEILHYLHNFDDPIIHRDITPDNLVLNEASGQLTLIDFGAANEVALQSSSTIIGKQCYIAPEQLRGAACIQSDLFSLGATMYFLLTGADPVPISTSRPLQVKNTVSKAMNELVARLTDMEAGCRPGSAKLVIDILNHPQLMQTSGSP